MLKSSVSIMANDSNSNGKKMSSSSNSFILKPSHFGSFGQNAASGSSENKPEENKPASNPFLKFQESAEENSLADEKTSDEEKPEKSSCDSAEKKVADPLAQLSKSTLPKSNLFANVQSRITGNQGFVFGQNLQERVTGETVKTVDIDEENKANGESSSSGSNLLFSSSLTNNKLDDSANENDSDHGKENDSQSLVEAARKYEESRAQKRKYEEVETITGEEDEKNIVEINCKLFAFVDSNWQERGHGTLRLNDKNRDESRVVFRQAGNLRVLVNTKIWPGMIAEQSSPRSLRLTAIDSSGQVKVFLVMARPDLISKLHSPLSERVKRTKDRAEKEPAKLEPAIEVDACEKNGEPSPKKRNSSEEADDDTA